MPFVVFPQEKKQQVLILVLVGVIIAIVSVVYFGFYDTPSSTTDLIPGVADPTTDMSRQSEDIDVDFLFLEDERFQELKKYGEWPIKTGKTGRDNPFQPVDQLLIQSPEGMPLEGPEGTTTGEVSIEESVEELTIEEIIQMLEEEGLNEE